MELSHHAERALRKHVSPQSLWAPLLGCVAVAGCVFGIALAGGATGSALLVAPITFALLGVVIAVRRWSAAADLREEADLWIERGYEGRASRYAWRVEELTSAHERRLLARSVRDVGLLAEKPSLQAILPLNRAALRPHLTLLADLADRLGDLQRPVAAAGILAVHRLLTQPDSSLYAPRGGRIPRVEADLTKILDRLEVRR
ncbi:MAG TPA: hypothetical protein VFA42_04935 [Gaiellaceae bacterium]|nr:hypothetical protein [Gaiellaceae bacterium]